jgi:hypothetical protein
MPLLTRNRMEFAPVVSTTTLPPREAARPSSFEAPAPAILFHPGARDRAAGFCFAWSAYLFLHHTMVYWSWFRLTDSFGRSEIGDFVIAALFWVVGAVTLLRGASLRWFTALLIGHLIYEIPALPKTANHTILTICMNATMLAAIALAALRSRGRIFAHGNIETHRLFPRMFALLRLEVLTMYFFVVLHKLNADYFNPAYSCATTLYRDIVDMYPFIPSGTWTDPLCIYGAIGAEATIPLLLVFRRTRLAGVALGLLFHFMLSVHGNPFIYSFSALLYAAYFLFIPKDILGEIIRTWSKLLFGLRHQWMWFALIAALVASTVVLLRVFAPNFVRQTNLLGYAHTYLAVGVRFAWSVAALFTIFAFARAVWICRRPQFAAVIDGRESFFRPALSPMLVFPLIVAFNGFCPYLGLKTEGSFAMYANLRTEGTVNNHLFMPRLPLAGYQDDLVEIVDSSDPELRRLTRDGECWTYFELRRKLGRVRSDKFWVTFKRNGVEQTLRYATQKSDPAFTRLPWYERRFMFFRDVQLGSSPQHCGH